MKRILVLCTSVLITFAFISSARAETLTTAVNLSPANEVPPVVGLSADGAAIITIAINRDGTGNITSGTVNFHTIVNFPGSVTITAIQIYEGAITATGSPRINAGVSNQTFAGGRGQLDVTASGVPTDVLRRLLANTPGFYINLQTTSQTNGALRGQLTQLSETLSSTIYTLSGGEVVPPNPSPYGGSASVNISPRRDSNGGIIGGLVNFTVIYTLGRPDDRIIGLEIRQAAAGANGPVLIDSGIAPINLPSPGNLLPSGVIYQTTGNLSASIIMSLLANPASFYVNLRTSSNPNGELRGQLPGFSPPPIIQHLSGSAWTFPNSVTVTLDGSGMDENSNVLLDGLVMISSRVPTFKSYDPMTGQLVYQAPATNPRTDPVTLFVQIENAGPQRSTGRYFTIASASKLNTIAPVTVDAAAYGASVGPDSIVTMFGTKLSTGTAAAAALPLPTTLSGTTVYVSGVPAPLLFVSPGQINYLIPSGIAPGTASVVVVSGDGTISQGQVVITPTAPAIFTTRADGTGAPAAVASTPDMPNNFSLLVGNPDGTPRPLDVGGFVSLFGTGFRFAQNSDLTNANGVAESVTLTIGGVSVTSLFVGPQGQFVGLDQINFQIPGALAGRGIVDLVMTIDGRASNPVKLNIR